MRINIKSVNEVNYWCRTLNCTETRLRNAMIAVGASVADVQTYLNRWLYCALTIATD